MENNVSIGLSFDSRREMKKLGAGVFGVKADFTIYGPSLAVRNTLCDDAG